MTGAEASTPDAAQPRKGETQNPDLAQLQLALAEAQQLAATQKDLYLRAMAELGPGVVRSNEVATLLGKKTAQVAPVRDTLMKKAICFSPRFNELAFTVPMFDQFMRRWMPSLA